MSTFVVNPRKDYSHEIGKTYGHLKVLDIEWKSTGKRFKPYAVIECRCGNKKSSDLRNIMSGRTISCGCERRKGPKSAKTHGLSNHKLYSVFNGMKRRCYIKDNHNYHRYGGRGIKICEQWLNDFESFYNWSIENGFSEELTIDRINNDGDYCPENCRWTTPKEQAKNRDMSKTLKKIKKPVIQRDLHTNEVLNVFESIKEASDKTGVKHANIYHSLKNLTKHAGGYNWEYKNKKEGLK